MTKEQWQSHIVQVFPNGKTHDELIVHAKTCLDCAARRKTRAKNKYARDKHECMTSLGLVRVKGNMGGTYYE